MFVSEFVKFATTLPPEREDGQPKAPKQDSFLADAIRQHGIPITITDYETGVEEEPLPKKAAGGVLEKSEQPRHSSGKFSTLPERAITKEDHEAAAGYHDSKSGTHHVVAAEAHRTAARLKESNSPVAGIYSDQAQTASEQARKEDEKTA